MLSVCWCSNLNILSQKLLESAYKIPTKSLIVECELPHLLKPSKNKNTEDMTSVFSAIDTQTHLQCARKQHKCILDDQTYEML